MKGNATRSMAAFARKEKERSSIRDIIATRTDTLNGSVRVERGLVVNKRSNKPKFRAAVV